MLGWVEMQVKRIGPHYGIKAQHYIFIDTFIANIFKLCYFRRRDDIMYECMTSLVLEQLELHCKIARLEIIKVLVSENEGMLCLGPTLKNM